MDRIPDYLLIATQALTFFQSRAVLRARIRWAKRRRHALRKAWEKASAAGEYRKARRKERRLSRWAWRQEDLEESFLDRFGVAA